MNIKSDFLEAVNLTPDGIDNFLGTPIPALVSFSVPTDVDTSIVAQGKLAYNINLILKAFEGLTPIELLLRIGQHNSVLQGALLAGLEYAGSGLDYEIKILDPSDSHPYPLPVNVVVQVVDGIDYVVGVSASAMAGEISGMAQNPETPAFWTGSYTNSDPMGTTDLMVVAIFNKDGESYQASASVSFSWGDDGP